MNIKNFKDPLESSLTSKVWGDVTDKFWFKLVEHLGYKLAHSLQLDPMNKLQTDLWFYEKINDKIWRDK